MQSGLSRGAEDSAGSVGSWEPPSFQASQASDGSDALSGPRLLS